MTGDRRSRWAVSFADLALLLLGFFVLLQASGERSAAVLRGVGAQFGAKGPENASTRAAEWRSAELFVSGEAILTDGGNARIAAFARRFAAGREPVELTSAGQDRAAHRFDAWDLAAARLGAVARALEAAGIAEGRLTVRAQQQAPGQQGGQRIGIVVGAGGKD